MFKWEYFATLHDLCMADSCGVWQKPTQYFKAIILQLKRKHEKKKHDATDNKVLLYSTGNYIQYPMINQNGKEYEK